MGLRQTLRTGVSTAWAEEEHLVVSAVMYALECVEFACTFPRFEAIRLKFSGGHNA